MPNRHKKPMNRSRKDYNQGLKWNNHNSEQPQGSDRGNSRMAHDAGKNKRAGSGWKIEK